jgi:hypothetical protein
LGGYLEEETAWKTDLYKEGYIKMDLRTERMSGCGVDSYGSE